METKLCRICGQLGQNFVHIFKTEGLRDKIETCLPIIVSINRILIINLVRLAGLFASRFTTNILFQVKV